MRLALTSSQTIGPFFHDALLRDPLNSLVQPESQGERIRIEGRVLDGNGEAVPDAMVEIWQANAHGRYHHPADQGPAPLDPAFVGFGRASTDDAGGYWFDTIRPGPVPFDDTCLQAPHINVTVFSRGLLNHLATRLYFSDDQATWADPVLTAVPDQRRTTLIAWREEGSITCYRFDIVLQGANETVFFDH